MAAVYKGPTCQRDFIGISFEYFCIGWRDTVTVCPRDPCSHVNPPMCK